MKILALVCVSILFVSQTFSQGLTELTPIVEFAGTDTNGMFGFFANGVGDINKDGYNDFCVSAFRAKRTYLYYGGTSPSTVAAKSFRGGGKITSGDFNGDGKTFHGLQW